MGYAHYTINRNGLQIEAGYGVEDICNRDDCNEKIDRGIAYLCGATPGGDEHGCGYYFCGYYFCGGHMFGSPADDVPQLCGTCLARWRREQREEFADRLATVINPGPDCVVLTEHLAEALGAHVGGVVTFYADGRELRITVADIMPSVAKADVLDDQPFVVVEMGDGQGFVVQVTS
jgi:hypothetical protein